MDGYPSVSSVCSTPSNAQVKKSQIPLYLHQGTPSGGREAGDTSTPGSAPSYGLSSAEESEITVSDQQDNSGESDESLGIRARKQTEGYGSPSNSPENDKYDANNSKSSGDSSIESLQKHSHSLKDVLDGLPDAPDRLGEAVVQVVEYNPELDTPSPSVRASMLDGYAVRARPSSPSRTPPINFTNSLKGPFADDYHMKAMPSPKLESIDEVTEEMTAICINDSDTTHEDSLSTDLKTRK